MSGRVYRAKPYLAEVFDAIVDVNGAVVACPAEWTRARIVSGVVNARGAVLAGIEFLRTEVDLLLAVLAHEARFAAARIAFDLIHAGGIVLAFVAQAVVDVGLAVVALEARGTVTGEAAHLQHFASRAVLAGVAEARVYLILAVTAEETWRAVAVVVEELLRAAGTAVVARIAEAHVAFRQDVGLGLLVAHKHRRRRGQQEFISHRTRFGAASNARLGVVLFDALGQPPKVAVAVEWIGAHRDMCDGDEVFEGAIRDHRDVIAVDGQDLE